MRICQVRFTIFRTLGSLVGRWMYGDTSHSAQKNGFSGALRRRRSKNPMGTIYILESFVLVIPECAAAVSKLLMYLREMYFKSG